MRSISVAFSLLPITPTPVTSLFSSQVLCQLTQVNQNLIGQLELTTPKQFQSHSSAVEMEGWVDPPLGLKPNKKSPVILYTWGGPGGMRASVFCFEWQLYASLGYNRD